MKPRLLPVALGLLASSTARAGATAGDRATTTLGATATYSNALGQVEGDLLVGERLDVGLGESARLRFDGRFTFDAAGDPPLEWMRLTEAGVRLHLGDTRLDLGRSVVAYGGPRLVDGAQGLVSLGEAWRLGAWAGLAPDLFTTLPRLRYGGGPIVAWEGDHANSSLVGEILATPDGLDRLGALWLGRVELGPAVDLRGRLDVQEAGGSVGLADGAASVAWRPLPPLHVDGSYDAYSSLRYLESADLDPWVERFLLRAVDLGLDPGISEDLLDPRLRHMLGARVRWEGSGAERVAVVGGVEGRGRLSPEPEERYLRLGPRAGLRGLWAGRLDVEADLALTFVDQVSQQDVGLLVVLEPVQAPLSFDASGRLFLGEDPSGTGWYADLYVGWLHQGAWRTALMAGVFAESLSDQGFVDQAEGGLLRLQVDPLRGRKRRDTEPANDPR